ncbi:MAG: anhydro-N-acetylmuramic acid kinase [Elusimicrobia bacterium]|nr:MAG: anhydro-N-acetylmuramic acid kinase [Elusimicrobiota bacterium]KAF0154844.1 MAG: anhydro-N-acetylmuramic acid kinase [Elusimicrobiota bacterium]
MERTVKALGLMSGTSADGLSVACCELKGRSLKVRKFANYAYPSSLQARIIAAKDMRAPELSALNFELGRLWAGMIGKFCRANSISLKSLDVIGSHGQTVWHAPGRKGHTLQIGDPAFLAEATGVPVVSDFRPADMAAGGEGAPLVPFMDEYLYGGGAPVALQNIGGVGNISFVGKGVKTFGFDTGPGNSLMDTAVGELSGGKLSCDRGGSWAASGSPDMKKVRALLEAPFFLRRPPKSLDRSEYTLAFIRKNFGAMFSRSRSRDLLATLNAFTAASIALAFRDRSPRGTRELIVAGGGALNPVLMENISALLLPLGARVRSCAELGLHPLAKEPACFALLAALALRGRANHCPSATGARAARTLGRVSSPYPGRHI